MTMMKIEITEAERHWLLQQLGRNDSFEKRLHGYDKFMRGADPEVLYQKILLAKEEKSCTCV